MATTPNGCGWKSFRSRRTPFVVELTEGQKVNVATDDIVAWVITDGDEFVDTLGLMEQEK